MCFGLLSTFCEMDPNRLVPGTFEVFELSLSLNLPGLPHSVPHLSSRYKSNISEAKIFFGDPDRTGRRRQTPCSLERSGIVYSQRQSRISAAARLPGSDSTKLVQNHPIFMHFGTILGLQSGLGRGESSGSGLWGRTWTRTHFYKCCVRSSRPQDT